MWFKQLMAAATDWRTLIILGAGLVAAAVLSNPFPAIIGLGIYLWAVQRLASSPQLKQAAERIRVANQLQQRYTAMQQLYRQMAQGGFAGMPPTLERPWANRAQDVTGAATAIYNEWLQRPEVQAEKTDLVDQGLQLATLYLKILRAYQAIYSGRRPFDAAAVRERLARNKARLQETQDLQARQTLMQAIDLDERVLDQVSDDDTEQERYLARLAAIEATMDLLRREIYDPASGAEGLKLHEMLLEAEAMDQALEEVQTRTRVRA